MSCPMLVGFGFTDTSREIEALQAALQQVGMSTMGSTGDMSLHASSSTSTGTGATPVGDSRVTTGGATADGAARLLTAGGLRLKELEANSGTTEMKYYCSNGERQTNTWHL